MGLKGMIIFQVIIWIIGLFVKGISLYQILLIIPIVLFSFRKFGLKIGCGTIITMEILFLFFSTVFTILFSEVNIIKYMISLILRVISCLIVVLDDVLYVYVTEERKVN